MRFIEKKKKKLLNNKILLFLYSFEIISGLWGTRNIRLDATCLDYDNHSN